jgi:transforming growth factor-beta-induced protein
MKPIFVATLSLALALFTTLPARAQSSPGTIVEIAAGNPDFSTLVAAAQAAGLVETLSGPGPFTVFAPNNAAFEKLPAGTVETLLQDTNRLRQILLYHVVPGRVRSTDLSAGKAITAQGAAVTVDLSAGVKINDSTVIAADIEASNGIIHVIDSVLLPPPNIVEIAAGNPDFSTLVTAVQAAGLVDALSADGPYTVFAPNNAAFAKLPAGTVEALLQDTNRLRHILLYHVNHGPRLRSTDLQSGVISTMHGGLAKIDLSSGVKINQASVIAADIEASNGIIHVIDEVILPGGGTDDQTVSVSAKGDQITVVWPFLNGQTQVLEASPSLSSPSWTALNEPVTTADGVNKVSLPANTQSQFFRVRSTSP